MSQSHDSGQARASADAPSGNGSGSSRRIEVTDDADPRFHAGQLQDRMANRVAGGAFGTASLPRQPLPEQAAPVEVDREHVGSGERIHYPPPPYTAKGKEGDPPDLRDALQELNDSTKDAVDNDLPLPTAVTLENAETVLRRLYAIAPANYAVYPSPEGAMTIFDRPELGHAIAMHCTPEGGVLCAIVSQAHSDLRTFDSMDELTDREMQRAVSDMRHKGNPA